MSYTPKTDAEILEIATGIFKEKLFTTCHLRETDMELVPLIFFGLDLMDAAELAKFKANDPHMLYGNLEDTFPRTINGYPIFTKWSYANREDAGRIFAKLKEIQAAVAGVTQSAP